MHVFERLKRNHPLDCSKCPVKHPLHFSKCHFLPEISVSNTLKAKYALLFVRQALGELFVKLTE